MVKNLPDFTSVGYISANKLTLNSKIPFLPINVIFHRIYNKIYDLFRGDIKEIEILFFMRVEPSRIVHVKISFGTVIPGLCFHLLI